MTNKERCIIIGDIHGCIEEFDELLKTLSYNSNTDRVILLGDLIDRGPDSLGVVRRARELNLECVLGNHECKFLKWYKTAGTKVDFYDRNDFYTKFSEDDINYIFRMSNYIQIGNFVAVHAGLKPGIALSKQGRDNWCYLRYTDSNGKFISIKLIAKIGKEAAGAHFWTEYWKGPESVVYGHNVHSMESPLIEEVNPGVFCYGIDTGCCFGGKLSALILDTKEIVQVQAKQTYYKSEFNI
jgi:hypothetical protein